jgi:hypothetical protein
MEPDRPRDRRRRRAEPAPRAVRGPSTRLMAGISLLRWRARRGPPRLPGEGPAYAPARLHRCSAMLRKVPPAAVALALVLGAAPAFAQSGAAPEDATAARTLEQNRRVLVWPPAPSEVPRGLPTGPVAPVAGNDRAGPVPAGGAGRRS